MLLHGNRGVEALSTNFYQLLAEFLLRQWSWCGLVTTVSTLESLILVVSPLKHAEKQRIAQRQLLYGIVTRLITVISDEHETRTHKRLDDTLLEDAD